MEIEYNGIKTKVNIIGEFKIADKEYVVCSYEDDQNNNKIAIVQIVRDATGTHAVDIPNEEIELVTNYYEEIKKALMEEENE